MEGRKNGSIAPKHSHVGQYPTLDSVEHDHDYHASSRHAALSKQNSALVELSRSRKILSGDLTSALREITESAARTLDVARVGVWLYNIDRSEIHCLSQYLLNSHSHASGAKLESKYYPNYFRALEEARTIAADNAATDERTREFSDSYLTPTGVTSLIDAPIRTARGVVGIVCHEHVGPPRNWAPDEWQFAGSIADFVCLALEAAERTKAESALKASEERIRSLLENVPDVILTVDRDARILFINHTEPQYNRDSIVGLSAYDFIPASQHYILRAALERAFKFGEPQNYEIESINGRLYSARLLPYAATDEISTCLIIAQDITEHRSAESQRQLLEVQLQHTQKLESLGVLAGGIAHDFNNLLVGILGNTTLVLESSDLQDVVKQRLTTVKKAAQRASELINQLLAYAGKASSVTESVDISGIIEEICEFLTSSISKRVHLDLNLDRNNTQISGDPTQIRQVILNLVVNAAEACGDCGGTVTVTAKKMNVSRDVLGSMILGEELPAGTYVSIEVSDNGCGMDETVLKRIFDPFFTTKFAGRGLGLAAVLGILKTHGGAVKVQSKPAEGTKFFMLFPSADVHSNQTIDKNRDEALSISQSMVTGMVLVIDDEPIVRDVTCAILKSFGFMTMSAAGGADGIDVFTTHQSKIDAVLLDMTMPDMTGSEVFNRIREISPEIPILLLSGFNEQQILPQFSQETKFGFLQKPYLPEVLLQKLNQIIPHKRISIPTC